MGAGTKAMTAVKAERSDGKCGAKTRKGKTCGRPAGWGTEHAGLGPCKLHGGCMPNVVKSAQRAVAARAVSEFALSRDIDPHTALLEELHRTAGAISWLEDTVRGLDEIVGPVGVEGRSSEDGLEHHPRGEAHVYVRMLQEERGHYLKVAQACVSAGIEERRIHLAEQQGQLLAAVITGVLEDLKLDPSSDKVRRVVRARLTAIAGKGTEQVAA